MTVAAALENGSHALVNGDDALVSAAVKAAAGGFASNSGYASSESGSCLIWTFPFQICPYWSRGWASWGYNRTHGHGNNCS